MLTPIYERRFSAPVRGLVALVLSAFLTTSVGPIPVYAQGQSLFLKPTAIYQPLTLKGIQLIPGNPLRFDFLADKGNSLFNDQGMKDESIRLIKYFLTALTIPERDMWVNLSPYERDKIIADSFGQTQMGKVFLEQDYILKQMTASLTYPERPIGQQFWSRVYQKSLQLYGTTDIPVNTFNKVWIIPKTADVVSYKEGVVIVDSQLDVMVESDYLAERKHQDLSKSSMDAPSENTNDDNTKIYAEILKAVIIPELRREVNEGKAFAPLRQVYQAMILAAWYKRHLKEGLLSKIYVRQNKVDGVNTDDPAIKEKVYAQYLETIRQGIYNYIREDIDEVTKETIPRKYMSGGLEFTFLGMGGPQDKYREVEPDSADRSNFANGPVMIETDLTLITSNGQRATLPDSVYPSQFQSQKKQDRTASPLSSGRFKWIKKAMWSTTLLAVLSLFPSYALGAQFSQDNNGNLIVQVEKDDTYGQIVQDIGHAYRSKDYSDYKKSQFSGNLWGPQGVVAKLSGTKDFSQLKPGDQLEFSNDILPQQVIDKLTARVNRQKIEQADPKPAKPLIIENVVKPIDIRMDTQTFLTTEVGLKPDVIGFLTGFAFIWGVAQFFKTGKRKSPTKVPAKTDSRRQTNRKKNEPAFKEGLKIITDRDELPRMDDFDIKDESQGIFVGAQEPVASEDEVLLWRQEQAASGARAFARSPRALWPLDVIGSLTGITIAGISSDWNLQAVGVAALVMPMVTRLIYGVQIFLHETLGHFIPALVLSPERQKVLTASNFFANLGWTDWMRLMVPGIKPMSENRIPGVDTWADGWRKKAIDISGFITSLGVSFFAAVESMNIWTPLLGPLAVTSLAVWAGSYATDIKGVKSLAQTQEDDCSRSECGIFGALWADNSKEIYPDWIRDGFTRLINALIIRGGQSAGEFAIGFKSAGEVASDEPSENMVPVLSKVLKYKRGGGLTETLDSEFTRLVNIMRKNKVTATEGVKGILGHVRFATGGKVTREASHPHMGNQEMHEVWTLESGRWVSKMMNIFVAIGHNGDNDIWKIWGLRLNTSQMRELFPAIFRMEKKFKVVSKGKNPKTGKNIKEVKYEALPPGDSPPLALQMHYLLTQGDWISSARFAYVESLVHPESEMALLSDAEMGAMTDNKLKQALVLLLNEQEEKILGETFQEAFLKHQNAILRPRLKAANKSFQDLWVTPAVVAAQPSLQYQLDALNALRADLTDALIKHAQQNTEVGIILRKIEDLDEAGIRRFVDIAVEKFFTGKRSAAVQEFAGRSEGSYGVAVRTSKEPNGVTLYSSDQGVTIGYNQKARLVTFSSEHSTLQYAFGDKGKMDELVFINPEQPGQMADVNLTNDPQASSPITIKVHSFALNRTMTPQEIASQQFPQDPSNPYWSAQVSYKDPDDIVMTDVAAIPKEVLSARQSWDDPDSFNRQSAEPLVEKMASRHLELYIKANSKFYGAAQGNLTARLFSASTECLASAGCSSVEANRRSAQLSNRLQADGRVLDYLKSRLDWVVGRLADDLAQEMVSGTLNETDLVVRFREKIDDRLGILMEQEIKSIVDAVIVGNIDSLQSWKDWQESKSIAQASEVEFKAQEDQPENMPEGIISKGLKGIADFAAGFMSAKPLDVKPALAKSLDSGETDMLVAGYEDSLWLGENFVNMMQTIFKRLNIWSTSTNKVFNLNGEHRVGRRTLSMIFSKSGATFPSRGIVRRLKQIAPGNIFAMTSRVDTLIAMALGQKFQPDSPFIKRIFVTGNYYPAEANSVGEVMLFAHQIELVLYLAERMHELFPEQKPWGMDLDSEDITRLKELRDKMYDQARHLTGRNEQGDPIDGNYIRNQMVEKLKSGYLRSNIRQFLKEAKSSSGTLNATEVRSVIDRAVHYNGPDADADIQSALTKLWNDLENKEPWSVTIEKITALSGRTADAIDEPQIRSFLIHILETMEAKNIKAIEDAYLVRYRNIQGNADSLGKTMAETGIVSNVIFRAFVMSIFWFGAPIENVFSFAGIHFGPTMQDFGGMLVRTLDGILTLFAPWLMTTLIYRTWSGRPHWARLGPPTVALGDPIPALHQTGEGFWSKLGALALGSMSMNVHGANPDDHFVARLAHRVVRGTIAIFGVPADSVSKDSTIVTMRQTKAIINGMFLNFFKGGAEVYSIGRGELNDPDVTDHHMNIGEQNLDNASKTVKKFNNYAFDAFDRHIAYKVLFAGAYDWATRWEPKITILGRTIVLKKFALWNDAWSYSRTSVHTTRSPKGGPTDTLPAYLDPSQDIEPLRALAKEPAGDEAALNREGGKNDAAMLAGAPEPLVSAAGTSVESSGSAQTQELTVDPNSDRRGGIDFDTKWLDLRVTESGDVNLFLDNKNIELVPISGIVPNILEIRPLNISNVFSLLEDPNNTGLTQLMERSPARSQEIEHLSKLKGGCVYADV